MTLAGKVWQRDGQWWCVHCAWSRLISLDSPVHSCQDQLFSVMHTDGHSEAKQKSPAGRGLGRQEGEGVIYVVQEKMLKK